MKKLIIILVIVICIGNAEGQTIPSLSLGEAQRMAISNSHPYSNELREQQKTEWMIRQKQAQKLPKIFLEAGFTRNLIRPVTILPGALVNQPGKNIPVPFGTDWDNSLSVDFRHNLINPIMKPELKALEISKSLSEVRADILEEELKLNVSRSYYDVLISMVKINQQRASLSRLQNNLSDINAKVEAGLIHAIEKERIQNAISLMEISIQQSEKQERLNRQVLNYYLGVSMSMEYSLDGKVLEEDYLIPINIPEQSPVISHLPGYQFRELMTKQAEIQLERQKKAYVPTLSLYGRGGTQALGDKLRYFGEQRLPWYFSTYVGLGINWQLNSMWDSKHSISIAQLEIDQATSLQQDQEETLLLEYMHAKNEVENSIGRLRVSQSNLKFAEKELSYIKIRFEGDLATAKDLIEAESMLQEAQDGYWVAVYSLLESKALLQKASGRE